MNAVITRRVVLVYADDALTTLAACSYYNRGYILSRSRKNRKRIMDVIFTQLPGMTLPQWVPIAMERESRAEQRQMTYELQDRKPVLPEALRGVLGS